MKTQRHNHKYMIEGKPFTMTKDCKEQLEKIGLPLSIRSEFQDERYYELLEFKNKHGQFTVPKK